MKAHYSTLLLSQLIAISNALPQQNLNSWADATKSIPGLADHCDNAGVSTDNWNKYGVGDWLIKWSSKYHMGALGWKWPTSFQNTLATEAGNFVNFDCSGVSDCAALTDQGQCKAKPEYFFVLSSIANFGHYLYGIIDTTTRAIPTAGLSAPDMSKNFTNGIPKPPTGPQQGLAIANGILGAISVVFPPAAVAAGAGGVVSGALGLAALDIPTVDDTWQATEEYLAQISKKFTTVISDYAHYMLETIPGQDLGKIKNPPDVATSGYPYADDPQGLPQIFSKGFYATRKDFGVLPQGFYASWTSSIINYLWNLPDQKVFIVKINKDNFGADTCTADGKLAIKNAADYAVCIDGNAHVLFQFSYETQSGFRGGIQLDQSSVQKSMKVPGVDKLGLDINGSIKLDSVIKSSLFSGSKVGWGKPMEAQGIIDNLMSDPGNISPDKLISFNLPLCDLNNPDAKMSTSIKCKDGTADCLSRIAMCRCGRLNGFPYKGPQGMCLDK